MEFPLPSLLLVGCINVWLISAGKLPLVDQGLFVIQGVKTCGLGVGYCLLSNSCQVDSDFENDTDNGHCDGLKYAFNPRADFVCCKSRPSPPDTSATTTAEDPVTEIPALPLDGAETLDSLQQDAQPDKQLNGAAAPTTEIISTTSTTEAPRTTKRTNVSPFNIAVNTNKLLNSIQHLLSGGRMRPSVVFNKFPPANGEGIYNDKSLLNLILLGLNQTAYSMPPRPAVK